MFSCCKWVNRLIFLKGIPTVIHRSSEHYTHKILFQSETHTQIHSFSLEICYSRLKIYLYYEFHSINKILSFEFDESVEFSSE